MANTWRYWRFFLNRNSGGLKTLEAFEIEFLVGATDQTAPGGTVSTNSDAFGLISKTVDNDTGTFWASNDTPDVYILYDFGGAQANWKAIDGASYMARSARGPNLESYIQCSHDATNWITAYTIATGQSWSGSGGSEKKTWSFTTPAYASSKRTHMVVQR